MQSRLVVGAANPHVVQRASDAGTCALGAGGQRVPARPPTPATPSAAPHRPRSVPLSDWDLPDAPDFNTRTNAELMDAGLAHQALSAHDIEAMKASLRLSSASLFLFFSFWVRTRSLPTRADELWLCLVTGWAARSEAWPSCGAWPCMKPGKPLGAALQCLR